ncbi:MAG: stage V sporulation protein S [Thermovenabulum sp.]|uniref:stage V sporulation protein S n=1 Tax=Thermovenabulum sp. TaxID=3100335 RepID=UPI003C7ACF76
MIKVSAKTNPVKLARYIIKEIRDDGIEIRAAGASAVNNTIKAVIIAQKMVDRNIYVVPSFQEGKGRNDISKVIKIIVKEKTKERRK